MSYVPLRDTFGIDDEPTVTAIWDLIERMAVEYRAGLHQDLCACDRFPDKCTVGLLSEPEVDFVIGWLLREAWVSQEQVLAKATVAR